jgi:hypothetical protein
MTNGVAYSEPLGLIIDFDFHNIYNSLQVWALGRPAHTRKPFRTLGPWARPLESSEGYARAILVESPELFSF